ncbi:MAG: ATP-binding protein (plasmid) [Leptolyngbya sp. BL-A-14]
MQTVSYYQENLTQLRAHLDRIRHYLENHLEQKDNHELPDLVDENSQLAQLCHIFNLSPLERDILVLCVGMELEPDFEPLCAKVNHHANKAYPTLGMALSVFPNASYSVLSAQNPLQRWKLIEFAAGLSLTQTAIRIDRQILCYLLHETAIAEPLADLIHPLPADRDPVLLPPSHHAIVEKLVSRWSKLTHSYPILQLCGSEATSKFKIAATACKTLGLQLKMISAMVLPMAASELSSLRQYWEREALLSNSVLLLNCDEISNHEPIRMMTVNRFLETMLTPVIVNVEERLHIHHRSILNFDVPSPTYQERRTLWDTHLEAINANLNGSLTNLTSQFNLSPAAIQNACEQIEPNQAESIKDQLWNLCRLQARPRLEDLAQRIESNASWEDLILPEQQIQTLKDMLIQLRQRGKVYEEWGFASKERKGLGISALFAGQSGTGKTMAAAVLANKLNLDLVRIDLSSVVSKYIGETEKNLRRIFDAAETGGAILLFDEADALFGKRSEVKDSHDRHANIEVSYLLQRMESYQGLAILTTNLKNALDTAFLRRIRFVLTFPFPDAQSRIKIWEKAFPPQTPTHDLNYNELGKLNVSGGIIRNIAIGAALLAADIDEPVMMKHILQSARNEYLKLELSSTELSKIKLTD